MRDVGPVRVRRGSWRRATLCDVIGTLIGLAVLGLIAGAVARLVVRSPGRLGCLGTIVLGIAGSYAGGTLAALLFHEKLDIRRASSILGAIVGAIVILWLWKLVDRRR
jgi:uncharacterized membrane protein YeaQ/YmgE (transglycosylase-associated protein family)